MTRFRSNLAFALVLIVAGCASSGVPAARIAEPDIAGAYLPLHARTHMGLDTADAAAVVILPGIAATNQHNANLVDPRQVIGAARDYDLMFYRTDRGTPPPIAPIAVGVAVTAYGQGAKAELRVAHGVVHDIATAPGFAIARWFTFEGDAGPGFSGGPVVDAKGRLIGITFAYKDVGGRRLIYAYDMSRVQAELDNLSAARPGR